VSISSVYAQKLAMHVTSLFQTAPELSISGLAASMGIDRADTRVVLDAIREAGFVLVFEGDDRVRWTGRKWGRATKL
jgi:hypothetical protein